MPSGPARDLDITGVSDDRLTRCGDNGTRGRRSSSRPTTGRSGATPGRTASRRARACSAPPGRSRRACSRRWCRRSATRRSRPAIRRPATARPWPSSPSCTATPALAPLQTWTRLWGTDPWTQGYVTNWRPGDVEAVGPLHGTHEPPFYVCGSDQWVAGYMEGAVRTGRAAARAALRREEDPMDFGLTEEQRSIVEVTRTFVERELYPHEEEVERTGVLRHELAEQIKAKAITAGLYAANMPEEVGGAGLDTVTWVLYEKELGRANYALHSCIGRPSTSCWPAPRPRRSVPLPEHPGRAARLPGADRAGRRLRPARHAHPRRARRRRVADQGHQALHQPRPGVRLRDPVRRHRRPGDGKAMSTFLVDLDTPGLDRARRLSQRLAPRLHQRDPRLRLLRAGDALLGEEGTASTWPAPGWAAPGCRWPRPASAGPSARSTSPYAMPRSGSSSARRSAASRASRSSSPTWRSSCAPRSC